MDVASKEQGFLSEFFSYNYQSRLIHYAQMLNPSYEEALIEYWGIFTVHLINCYEEERKDIKNHTLYTNVRRILNSTKDDSIISEMFALIGSAYHRWTTCDLGTAIKIMSKILYEIRLYCTKCG